MSSVGMPPQVLYGPIQIRGTATTTPDISLRYATGAPLKASIDVKDANNAPVTNLGITGGWAVFGDFFKAFRGGEVFNPDFNTMTGVGYSLAADAAGLHLGYGATASLGIFVGNGAPSSVNPITTGVPADGSVYFRKDGGAGTTIYQVRSGAWVATGA